MVENLNKLTFSGYGRVLRDSLPNRGFPSGAQWQESVQYFSAEALCFYRQSAGPVYLDFELGMTVLAVRREGETAYFYLDKPVCLPAGREFAILPYQTECSVRLAQPAGAQLEVLEPVTAAENLKLGDRLHNARTWRFVPAKSAAKKAKETLEIYTLFYREVESGFLFKGEQHSMFELTYVDRGALHCVVDGNGVELHQGQLMVFGPQQWHMQYTDLDMTARFLTVSFDLESEFAARLPDRVFDLSSAEAAQLRQIVRESENMDAYSGDFIRSYLKLLLLSVLRDTGSEKKRLKTPVALNHENEIVSRTLQYVADHVCDKLSVEIVSREVGVSASHLTALFHRQMNISPGEYIRRVKLEESKRLIREGTMNFSQIAAQLNYSTIHHFSRQFKDKFGMSPSEYAKSIQSE